MTFSEVMKFGAVVREVVQLPFAIAEWCERLMQRDNFPTVAVKASVSDHFVERLCALRGSACIAQCRSHARASSGLYVSSVASCWSANPNEFEKCREDVRDMRVLATHFTAVELAGIP